MQKNAGYPSIQKSEWDNINKRAKMAENENETEVLKGEREVIKRAHTTAPRAPKHDRELIHAVNGLISLRQRFQTEQSSVQSFRRVHPSMTHLATTVL